MPFRNAHNTNLIAIKNIISAAKSLLPGAKCAVVCDGACDCQPLETQGAIHALNDTLLRSPPNKVVIIEPPEDFSCSNGRWSKATFDFFNTALTSFLE